VSPKGGPGKLRTPDGEWTTSQISVILGCTGRAMWRYLSGERYPEVRMMKRFEALFGWPARDQIELIPVAGYDLRYSMVLREVIEDWKHNNPRTQPSGELRCLFDSPRGNYSRGQERRWSRVNAMDFDELMDDSEGV
jgi:hypothetical protein